jgi:hypothetical protein
MVIPDINNIPFATPTYNVQSGQKNFAGLAAQNAPQQPVILNQTIMQKDGENMDALVRRVTTATIEVLEKGNKRTTSEMGPRRS